LILPGRRIYPFEHPHRPNHRTPSLKSRFPALAGFEASDSFGRQIVLAAAACAFVDLLLGNLLLARGLDLTVAHTAAFAGAAATALVLSVRPSPAAGAWVGWGRRSLTIAAVVTLSYLLRAALVTGLADEAGWSPEAAFLPGVVVATLVNALGVSLSLHPADRVTPFGWPAVSVGLIVCALLMRVTFAGAIDLLPEESYYWAYTQDLDIGYLDHPPMVAWLIWLGTWLLGNDELGVRLPALACWAVTALFMFQLARNLYDRATGIQVLLLVSVLPAYFSAGFVMTPDAPLLAAWAGCLYYLERALVARQRMAWLGAGVCLGIGLLSKYTIALLGPAALVYLLLAGTLWNQLRRPEPYVAVALAILVFSPVIAWNASHEWASFRFQGPERWTGPAEFSLHQLVGYVLLLLTPFGLVGIIAAFVAVAPSATARGGRPADPRTRFALVFTLLPLAIFLLHALHGQTKLNWTEPVWLAALPLLASQITARIRWGSGGWSLFGQRLWFSIAIACLLTYGVCLHYIQIGLPGFHLKGSMSVPVAWEEMAEIIDRIDRQVATETGAEPLVVGMDKYFTSSQYAFYDPDGDGFTATSGRHLFGGSSLMWAYWHPALAASGRNVVLIAFSPARLAHERISCHFQRVSPITKHWITKHGRLPVHFYARVGYDYDPDGSGCET
jgi:dolichol-phosphate mannosyltransferase